MPWAGRWGSGRIITAAGTEVGGFGGENGPAPAATFAHITDLAASPDQPSQRGPPCRIAVYCSFLRS